MAYAVWSTQTKTSHADLTWYLRRQHPGIILGIIHRPDDHHLSARRTRTVVDTPTARGDACHAPTLGLSQTVVQTAPRCYRASASVWLRPDHHVVGQATNASPHGPTSSSRRRDGVVRPQPPVSPDGYTFIFNRGHVVTRTSSPWCRLPDTSLSNTRHGLVQLSTPSTPAESTSSPARSVFYPHTSPRTRPAAHSSSSPGKLVVSSQVAGRCPGGVGHSVARW